MVYHIIILHKYIQCNFVVKIYRCFTVKTVKISKATWYTPTSPFFLHFLKDYTKGSKITNLRSIYHPERRDYDVAKMRFKTGAGKT